MNKKLVIYFFFSLPSPPSSSSFPYFSSFGVGGRLICGPFCFSHFVVLVVLVVVLELLFVVVVRVCVCVCVCVRQSFVLLSRGEKYHHQKNKQNKTKNNTKIPSFVVVVRGCVGKNKKNPKKPI